MKTIIIPTDYSKNAMRAVDFAFDFFNEKGNHFILCNFYDIPRGGTSRLFTLLEKLKEQAEKNMLEIRAMVEKKHENYKVNLSTKVLQGTVHDEVVALGKETGADFVIMGTKGASGIKEMLIGSNASKVLKNVDIPVFAIPEDYNRYFIEELFFSYDGKQIGKKAATIISSFSKQNDLAIKMLHVRKEDELPIQNWAEVEDQFDNRHISLHEIYSDSYEGGIKKAINHEKCILVLIRRKKSIWEQLINKSDSQKAVKHLTVPILVVPE